MDVDYARIVAVEVRDGVVTKDSLVWMHYSDSPPQQMLALQDWPLVLQCPLYCSISPPNFTVNEDGETVYEYEDPYPEKE